MVPKARLELAWAVARHPLKMVCLPVPPLRQLGFLSSTWRAYNQIISALEPLYLQVSSAQVTQADLELVPQDSVLPAWPAVLFEQELPCLSRT